MINGLFTEVSEEEMISTIGGCGGGKSFLYVPPAPLESCKACSDSTTKKVLSVIVDTVAAAVGAIAAGVKGAVAATVLADVVKDAIDKEYNETEHNPNSYQHYND